MTIGLYLVEISLQLDRMKKIRKTRMKGSWLGGILPFVQIKDVALHYNGRGNEKWSDQR